MASIVIKHRNGEPISSTRIYITKAEQTTQLLAEDVIKIDCASPEKIDFCVGDYLEYCGKTYTLNQLPTAKKANSRSFTYSASFEGEQYELMDSAWILPANTYGDSFTGDLKDFLDILLDNVARTDKEWRLGTYPENSEVKTLTYTQTNCLQVLQNLCREYEQEFDIVREGSARILNIKEKVGGEFLTPFEYGRTGGAYNIERRTSTNKNVITKLFVFGSDKNLPSTYRENKLCLPGKTRNESFISDDESVRLYDTKENVKYFTDIFPARYGTVSAIDESNVCAFFDDSMDFDINEKKEDGVTTKWLIPGATAKVQFNSGSLAGYSFDINEYDHKTKRFRLKRYTDPNGLNFPNDSSAAFQISVGDKYFISDIRVPDSYVTEAENKLQEEAEKYFEENCKPQVEYNIELDSFFLKNLYGVEGATTEIFRPGQIITIHDTDLEMDKELRLSGFTRDLLNPYNFKINIAEKVLITTTAQRIVSELSEIKEVVRINDLADPVKAKRNWQTTQDVINSVFDPEGDYYTEKIKPGSIETQLLAVGARSQQFILKNVTIECNYTGNPNTIHNTGGSLEHYTIMDNAVKVWNITEGKESNLDAGALYYVYAKCERQGDNGIMLYDSEQHLVDSDPQYYYFLCGTITPVMTDGDGERPARNIALTYGNTNVNGRFVNTGRIQSQDGKTFFDLDSGEIGGRIDFQDSVITETILIKNGKDSAGRTEYCGAISGNADLPVLWISDKKVTDSDEVKELASENCPLKITKEGVGTNIGPLNIVDNNIIDILGDSGNIRISANSIIDENKATGALSLTDKSPQVSISARSENMMTDKIYSYEFITPVYTVFSGQATKKQIICSEVSAGNVKLPVSMRIRYSTPGSASYNFRFDVTVRLRLEISSDNANWRNKISWDKYFSNEKKAYSSEGNVNLDIDANIISVYNNSFNYSGKALYIRGRYIIEMKLTVEEEEGWMYYSPQMSFPATSGVFSTFHFFNTQIANIIAGGGYTCSLDSDNYFKLYPSNDNLRLDMRCTYAMQHISLSASASGDQSYIDGYRFGPVVFVKFKILRQHLGGSALRLPTWARPYTTYDGNTWNNYNFSVNSDGNITSPNLPSGDTLWGCVTYITTTNH